ncbi:MAG: porin family protein [Capnocytophaga sp.]|nr:porin family protein [Capnocytophaga sp.]
MKKIILVAAIAVAGVWSASAQSFGVKAGYNHANLSGDTPTDLDFKANSGFYVGALVELSLTDFFAIQPEVIYSRQGAKAKILTVENTLNMDYLNVPVMAKVKLGDSFSVLAGPQFGFLIGDPEWKTDLGSGTTTDLGKDSFAKFDVGLGIGAMFKTAGGLFVDARYTHGLTNTFDKDNDSWNNISIGDKNDFKNSVFSIGLGFIF